jgi:[ribosomal protein S5]-alanine N-acetyltransferase
MNDIRLLYITPDFPEALEDIGAFEATHGVHLNGYVDTIKGVISQTEALRQRLDAPPEWGGYLTFDSSSSDLVGCCGFRGAPDYVTLVEIAYGTFPPFEGRGYATAMARALVRIARDRGLQPIAHTLPENKASVHVLERLGFVNVGTVIADPEDGPVWRWELPSGHDGS